MNIQDRIVYSREEMLHSLNAALEQLNVFRYDQQYRQYLGEAFVKKFAVRESEIKKRKDDPLTIVVIGNFKRGKSSLLNALLQEEVATTDVTPETVTLNRVSYGLHDNELILSGNRKVKISDDELRHDALERIISSLDSPVIQLNIHRPNDFLRKITIIDTPGLNDATQDFSDLVKSSLLQADAIIYVFNLLYPISQTEQFFLRSAVIPQQFTTLFMVGNFTDSAGAEEAARRMGDVIRSRLSNLLPDAKIYLVSALDELCRVLDTPRPNVKMADFLANEFQVLRQDLQNLIDEKADSVVVDRMQRLTSAMLAELNVELDSIEQGLRMSRKETEEFLRQVEENREQSIQSQKKLLDDMAAQIESMRNETKIWMREFLERIIDETKNLESESDANLRKYYEYYCVEILQKALNTCVEHHREQLYDILDGLADSLTQKFAVSAANEKYRFRFKLDNRVWTNGDNVGLAVSFLGGTSLLGAIGSLAIDGISGYLRENEIEKRKGELLRQINLKLPTLQKMINKTVDEIYRDLGNNLSKIITEYFQDELENNEHLARQAVEVSEKESSSKEKIASVVTGARDLLKSVESQIFTKDIANIS